MFPARKPTPMGRAVLLILRLTSLFLVLAVVGLLIPSALLLYPSPPQVGFDPASFTERFDPNTNTVHIQGNVSMTIEGVYDLENVALEASVRNQAGLELVNLSRGPFTLNPKRAHTETLDLAIDLGDWIAAGGNPILNPDSFTIRVGARATYTAGYVGAAGALQLVIPWQPLLRTVLVDTANATGSPGVGTVTWSVPYTLDSAPYLRGSATVEVTLRNSTSTVATNISSIPLGTRATGRFNFTMDNATAAANDNRTLTVVARITLLGGLQVTTSRDILWRRP